MSAKRSLLFLLSMFWCGIAWAQPIPPGNVQAQFRNVGNYTDINWTARADYRVFTDLRLNSRYDFTPLEVQNTWDQTGGTWSLVSSDAVLRQAATTSSRMFRSWAGGAALRNYSFSGRLRTTQNVTVGQVGVIFRYVNANNYYFVAFEATRVALYRLQAGALTLLAQQAAARAQNTWYNFRVTAQNNTLQAVIGSVTLNATDAVHTEGSFGFLCNQLVGEFQGVTTNFELRDSGPMVRFSPSQVMGTWRQVGDPTAIWNATAYELRQSINTPLDTGFLNPKHNNLTDYTYVQQMRINPASDDDVIGLYIRYRQNQADPHRFTSYVFEWSRGGAVQPFRRLVRFNNGGYGTHGGTWQRINQTVLFSDNVTWVAGTWYAIRVNVTGRRIRVWIDGTLWADFTDNSTSWIQQGAAGPLNWSNPNFNARHMTLYYNTDVFTDAVSSTNATVSITNNYTRLNTNNVGTLLATPISLWADANDIPPAFLTPISFRVAFVDPSTFEGLISPDGVASTPQDASAYVYGRVQANTLRYHVYRNNTRLTATPITTQSYRDNYTPCSPPPNTAYSYEITAINPANQESARSAPPASITTTNDAPTIAGTPNQTGTHGTAWVLDVTPYINDLNAPANSLTITTNSSYVTVTGQSLRFLYPVGDPITGESVVITVRDCHGASASQTIQVTLTNRPPAFTSTPPTGATQNQQYTYAPTAVDPDTGDTLAWTLRQAPPGASFDAATGRITWTPTSADSNRSFTFEIEVCDNRGACARQQWTVFVTNVNDPPVITSTPPTTGTQGQGYAYAATAVDPDAGDTLTWSLDQAPAGATVNPQTGLVTWTPNSAQGGRDADFTLKVCDAAGACATQSWKVNVTNVNDPPQITSTPPTTGTQGQAYGYQPTANDPDPNETLTWSLDQAPTGATINPQTGEIQWTPGAEDGGREADFTLKVCDAAGACVTQTWKVNVTNVNDPPQITSTPPTQGEERSLYNYRPTATDADPNDTLNWKIIKAPTGATIDPATGEIRWTPQTGDGDKSFDMEIEVCDAAGACTRQAWTVQVRNLNDPPVITSTPPSDAFAGREMTYAPQVSDPDPNDTHNWKFIKAPSGATIDPTTGQIRWTPVVGDAGKEVEFEIEVCDSGTPPLCARQAFKTRVLRACVVDVDCPQGELCADGACRVGGCALQTPKCATAGDICINGQCTSNPCSSTTCATDETCRPNDGACIKPCAGVTCPQGQVCADGQCQDDACAQAGTPCTAGQICDTSAATPRCVSDPCSATSCRFGRVCSQGRCIDDPCPLMSCPAPDTQRCLAGQCVDRLPCGVDSDCPQADICVAGRCIAEGCYTKQPPCPQQIEFCSDALCKADTCQGAASPCAADEFCRPFDGKCAKPCSSVSCAQGQRCVDGSCQADPCASVQCAAGQICIEGRCEVERCQASNLCKHGRLCDPLRNQCTTDPCFSVKCPDAQQICRSGQCVAPPTCVFDKDCPTQDLCVNGSCIAPECSPSNPCPQGKLCIGGRCLDDACASQNCPADEVCRAGSCVDSCVGIFCPQGKRCQQGQCVDDLCSGVQCPQGQACRDGQCVADGCVADACKGGRLCEIDRCVEDPCLGVVCPQGATCQQGQCVGDKPCKNDADCEGEGVCLKQICAPPGCYRDGCPAGKLCLQGQCVDDPCASKTCAAGERCRPADLACVKDCPTCLAGERCVDGACQPDPCSGVQCNAGERCREGQCAADACTSPNTQLCKFQRNCAEESCLDDPCVGLICGGNQTCRAGICVTPPGDEGVTETVTEESTADAAETVSESVAEGVEPVTPEGDERTNEGDIGDKQIGDQAPDQGAGMDTGIVGGGCGCQGQQPFAASSWFFLLLLFFAAALRRQRAFSKRT